MAEVKLTAIYEPVEAGWVQARIEELPGVITAGRTREEAKELLLDALREYLLALGREMPDFTLAEGADKEPLVISLTA
jgi:predicted RNase H-like HicB family nuclease